jgi:uncharacterized repeat protein (TIGR01451 family)
MIASLAPGVSAVFPLVVKVTAATPAGTIIANTATVSSSTTDPSTGNDSMTILASVQSPATLSATKGVTSPSGTFSPGSLITYTIVLTNGGPSTQQDNAGDELVDVLPSSLNLVSAAATQGTVVATSATNTVTWNGSLVAGDSVTITIQARIGAVAEGTTIENQATASFDTDGDGSNEASAPTDNPSEPGDSDTTPIVVGPAEVPIPTLSPWALLALAALLALMAKLKRYRVR